MDDVLLVGVPWNFGPQDHEVIAKVAQSPGSKILDCSSIANVPMNLCEIIASGWAAPAGTVPRLAVVAQIDAWSLVKMMAPRAIQPLRAKGCEMRLFYARQLSAGHVHQWVRTGAEPAHELAATLHDLDQVWQGTAYAANVITAVLEVIRTDTTPARASYLATLANVARKFADPSLAASVAEEASRAR